MSIDTQVDNGSTVEAGDTPAQISISQILEDLDNGLGREEIATKYSLKRWEVAEMFKDPALKGKKAKKKRKLSFTFVRDVDADGNPVDGDNSNPPQYQVPGFDRDVLSDQEEEEEQFV